VSKTNTLIVRTPEGIVFSQLLAGPVTRFLAWLIDGACIIVISIVLGIIAGLLGLLSAGFAQAASMILFFAISTGYSMILEWYWRGQTIGKRVLRLRVVDAQGLRLHFSQIVIRNLLRNVDMLPAPLLPGPYLIGGLACLLSRRAQRLGDIAANTIVIRTPQISQPDLDQLLADKFNSLREHPHLEARLRQRVSPAEASVALQALLRRDELDPATRVELFENIATHFRSKVTFPPEVTDGITDEQYVRNVIDVLYRPRTRQGRTGVPPVPNNQELQEAR
jgi:uncharacterized RDD family membrane protein YckC